MHITSLDEGQVNFKSLEKDIYKEVCQQACNILSDVLKNLDLMLMDQRDKKQYRAKGIKHTCLKTIMGPVEFERRIYEYQTEDGNRAFKYLLDEYLKMDTVGHMSANLVEKVIDCALNVPYRKAAENVSELTGQSISHMAAWNLVQVLGEKMGKREDHQIELNKHGNLKGERETKVLFEEADGLWISMQRKDRPKNSRSKKRELKLAVTYEGWSRRPGKAEAYVVKHKCVSAGFTDSKKFKQIRDAKTAAVYDVDGIDIKIINGDGASWMKEGTDEEGIHFQLDPFHKSQAVVRNVPDKKAAAELIRMLNGEKAEESLHYVKKLQEKEGIDTKAAEKLYKLYNYLAMNRDGIVPYHLREGLKMPAAPVGMTYRHLGTMEHNVCDILAQRMKHNKTSWTVSGADHIAKILAEKASGSLYATINAVLYGVIPDEKFQEIVETVILTAAQVNKQPKKSNVYPVHKGSIPFEGSAVTEGRKAIRNMLQNRCSSEFIYR